MNSSFSCIDTPIEGLKVVTPFFTEDDRGHFLKSYEQDIFEKMGIEYSIFEEFQTLSKRHVIRGVHFQVEHPQAKYVRAITGAIFDVAVDLRSGSGTFGMWHGEVLSSENRKGYLIPAGFAHGFQVISDSALVSYACKGRFSPSTDTGIRWNDGTLAIDWPHPDEAITSPKDAQLMSFDAFVEHIGALPGE